ncbi:uncharacterized protein [Centruroides vittatus]|uniref:uncharacterized protein isoform X3 n=1 Tax=Centruroides vittatus TaxID=120091 RepID=UPI0035100B22
MKTILEKSQLYKLCFILMTIVAGLVISIIFNLIEILAISIENQLLSETKLNEVIYEEIRNYFYLHESSFLDTMHTQLECCGIRGWNDFVRQMDRANRTPRSCLLIENQLNVGCTSKLIPYINTKWITLIVFYVIFIISQITTLMSVLIKIKWQFKTQHSSVNNG